jgi:hypothetical protein
MICVYVVLTECYGRGTGQIRVAFVDGEEERPLFGSPEQILDFTGRSPPDTLGIVFRLTACPFPWEGQYSVQFWYNGVKLDERPLRLWG